MTTTLLASLLALPSGACSVVMVSGPKMQAPDPREPEAPVCTNSRLPIVLDAVGAVGVGYGTLLAGASEAGEGDTLSQGAWLAGLGVAAAFGASMLYGLVQTDDCRRMQARWAEIRAAQMTPPPAPAASPANPPPPAAAWPAPPAYPAPPMVYAPAAERRPEPVRRTLDTPTVHASAALLAHAFSETVAENRDALWGLALTAGFTMPRLALELVGEGGRNEVQGYYAAGGAVFVPIWRVDPQTAIHLAGSLRYTWRVAGAGAQGLTVIPGFVFRRVLATALAVRLQAGYFVDLFEETVAKDPLIPTPRRDERAHGLLLGVGVELP